jgi:hypothetical protein
VSRSLKRYLYQCDGYTLGLYALDGQDAEDHVRTFHLTARDGRPCRFSEWAKADRHESTLAAASVVSAAFGGVT